MKRFFAYFFGLLVLLLLQEFVVGRIGMGGYMAAYVYIMVIIMLPVEIKGWVGLLLGFGIGWLMDIMSGQGGLNAIVCTWLCFVRPAVISVTLGADSVQGGGIPTMWRFGNKKFLIYLSIMTLAFTVPFFLIESMGSYSWIYTPIRLVASSFFTVVLIYFFHLPFNRRVS